MANEKISALPTVTNAAIGGTSIFPVVDSTDGVTKSIALNQIDLRYATKAQGNAALTALTGDVTAPAGGGSTAATIAANAVTNAKAAQMAANTLKGNNTAGTLNSIDLSVAQVLAMLGIIAPTVSLVTTISHSGGFSANGSGNYTTPAGAKLLKVTCIGGGGGGGGALTGAAASSAAGGGGAGATLVKWIFAPISTYPFVCGPGGAGGVAGNNAGTAGTATTFGTALLNAGGGAAGGGGGTAVAVVTFQGTGGLGGTTSTGDLNEPGGQGLFGFTLSAAQARSGDGGASSLGAGGQGKQNTQSAGGNGVAVGSGGSGGLALNGGASVAGGAGLDGMIFVEEFYF